MDYLVHNQDAISSSPIDGSIHDIYILYSMFAQNFLWHTEEARKTYQRFYSDLSEISRICGGCINTGTDEKSIFQEKIEYIDFASLVILQNTQLRPGNILATAAKAQTDSCYERTIGTLESDENKDISMFARMMNVLEIAGSISPNAQTLSHLERILSMELSSKSLSKERARLATEKEVFIPICSNEQHSSLLSAAVNILDNKIVSLQTEKLRKMELECEGLTACTESHIHFIPNLKPQTDLLLGDCSYLDTCHKLNSCRYIHYLQYYPDHISKKARGDKKKSQRASFYTHGECCSSIFKELVPPQWIKCDVRKFDFSILGKFSAVIADPAWNIHMNLPYGTCNDNELLALPFDLLQDEGLIFLWVTGRAIELGKESLQNWGYKVINGISWIKTNQLGRTIVTGRTGHWLNHSKEHLLVGLKGDPAWLNRQIDIDLIISATRETSRKPDELYGIIERLVGIHARKLEIFGRDHNVRPGWFTIGNQVTGSCIHELDVRRKYEFFKETFHHSGRQKSH